MIQPYYRYCGKKIRKKTHTVYFVEAQEEADRNRNFEYASWVVGQPATKNEAQRPLNQQIVSVTRADTAPGDVDEFLCNGTHAQRFIMASCVPRLTPTSACRPGSGRCRAADGHHLALHVRWQQKLESEKLALSGDADPIQLAQRCTAFSTPVRCQQVKFAGSMQFD